MLKTFRLSLLLLISASFAVFSQGVSQTPYAQFGVGDVENQGNTRQQGMGGVGVSMPSPIFGNPINPALLAYNRSYVIFDAGFYGQTDNIRSATQAQRITTGNVNYFSLLFPISTKNWTVSIGLNPYSNSNARFQSTRQVFQAAGSNDTTSRITDYNAFDGGLNQVYMAHGIRLPKGFSLGISFNYIFGGISRDTRSVLNYYGQSSQTQATSKEQYSLLEFKPGVAWYKKINEKYSFNTGATFTFNTDMGSSRKIINSIVYEQKSTTSTQYSSTFVPIYTNTSDSTKSTKILLPNLLKIGVSLDNSKHWNVGLDYTFGNWSNYSGFDKISNTFANSHKIALGGEFIPDYNADGRTFFGFLKNITYRLGGYYYITPLKINNVQLNEFAGSFGMGLPFGKGGGLTSLNLAISVGQRGTTSHDLIQENFVRFYVGLNINDRWFIRYKLD